MIYLQLKPISLATHYLLFCNLSLIVTSISLNKATQTMHNFKVPEHILSEKEIRVESLTIVRSPPIGSTNENVNIKTYDRHQSHYFTSSKDHSLKFGQAKVKTIYYPYSDTEKNLWKKNEDSDIVRATPSAKSQKRYLKAKGQNVESNKSNDGTSNLRNSESKSPKQQTEVTQSESKSTMNETTKKEQAKVNKAQTNTEDSRQKKVRNSSIPIIEKRQAGLNNAKTTSTEIKTKIIKKIDQSTNSPKQLENKTKQNISDTSTSEKFTSKNGPIKKTSKIIIDKQIPKDPQKMHNAHGINYQPVKEMTPSTYPTRITATPSKVVQLSITRPPTTKITSSESNNSSHEQTLTKVHAPTTFPTINKVQEDASDNTQNGFDKESFHKPSSQWHMLTTFYIALSPDTDKMIHKDVKVLTENVLKTLIGEIVSSELDIGVLIQTEASVYQSRSSRRKNSEFIFISYDIECTGIEDVLMFEPVLWQEVSLCLKCSYTDVGTTKDGETFRALFNRKIQDAFSSTIEDGRFLSTVKKTNAGIISVSEAGMEKDVNIAQNQDSNKNISENGTVHQSGKHERLGEDKPFNKTFKIGWILLLCTIVVAVSLPTLSIFRKRKKKLAEEWGISASSESSISGMPVGFDVFKMNCDQEVSDLGSRQDF